MRHNKGIAYMWGVHMTMVVAITMLKHIDTACFVKSMATVRANTCVHTCNVTSHGLTYIARAVTFTWLDFYIALFPNSCTLHESRKTVKIASFSSYICMVIFM